MDKEFINNIIKKLTDEGKIIEVGWAGLRLAAVPENASEIQIKEMRNAFFAGAQHLFTSILSFLDDDKEPTDTDMKRMSQVSDELQNFIKEFKEQTFT